MKPLGNSALIVLASVARGCRYGFDVMDDTGLKSGTVYRSLSRLEELGLVRSKWEAAKLAHEERRPRRCYYELTERGSTQLGEARADARAFVDKLSPAAKR